MVCGVSGGEGEIFVKEARGGIKQSGRHHPPNFEELIESLTNMLLLFSGGSRGKRYEVSKLGGGGGGDLGEFLLITFLNFLHFSSHYSNIMMESYCL